MTKILFSCLTIILLSGCTSETKKKSTINQINDIELIEGTVESNEIAKINPLPEVYKLPDSPTNETTKYEGYIGDLAINLTVNEHADNNISGSYSYKKHNNPIKINGTVKYEHCNDVSMNISEWADTISKTGIWQLYAGENMALTGFWFKNETSNASFPIHLKQVDDDYFISPLSAVIFNDFPESIRFYQKHRFVKKQSYNKKMVVVPNKDNNTSYLLPAFLPLYEPFYPEGAECSNSYISKRIGQVKQNGSDIQLDNEKTSHYIYHTFEILHSGPVDEFSVLHAENLTLDFEGNLCFSLISNSVNLIVKVEDLEAYGYHLEGDAFYLKNTMNIGLDANSFFSEEHPLLLYKKPDIFSDVEGKYEVEDNYFVIEEVIFKSMDYWLKVNVCEQNENADFHSKIDYKTVKTGWIKLYQKIGDSDPKLTLSYYGNGC
jgi:hypothetical protein